MESASIPNSSRFSQLVEFLNFKLPVPTWLLLLIAVAFVLRGAAPPVTAVYADFTSNDRHRGLTLCLPDEAPAVAPLPNWKEYHYTELERREGIMRMPYIDIDQWAIGKGVRITAEQARMYRAQGGISESAADSLTEDHFKRLQPYLDRYCPHLEENQRRAVLDIAYGMGIGNLMKSKLWREVIIPNRVDDYATKIWHGTAIKYPNNRQSRVVEALLWRAHVDSGAILELNQITARSYEIIEWRRKNAKGKCYG